MASSRNFAPHRQLDRDVVQIKGSFAPNGSSAISAASNDGMGWTVAYTSTGLFTITLDTAFVSLVSGQCSLQLATAADQVVQFGVIDVVTAKTVQIRSLTAGSLADVAANANNRIHFSLELRNSSLLPRHS
jgi:hypothetical protein